MAFCVLFSLGVSFPKYEKKGRITKSFSAMGENRYDCLELNTKPEIILSH